MVSLETIRASNLKTSNLENLVAVFVGGTHGVAESTVKELFLRTTKPRAYIIGRSQDKADSLCKELEDLNPGSQAIFIKKDISILKNVDEVCEELQRREKKINILFLSAGYMSLSGRKETPEGFDHKMAVNYYSRMRFTMNLMPELSVAGKNKELSRVLTVLAAGSEADIDMDNMDLKKNYTLHACLSHCVMMTDFMMEELSKRYPQTSFSHSYPGTVKSGITNQLTGPIRLGVKVLYSVMTPWILNFRESGERHLFQITSSMYKAKDGSAGIPLNGGLDIAVGMDGLKGSGAYLLDWDGRPAGDMAILRKYRDENAGPKIWEHTLTALKRAAGNKRMADENEEQEQKRREQHASGALNMVGWRAG
ncbi:hypothetical protein M436DRAFT_42599 [Aureobasidium namibiae CBS 147.97]|uniref:NAD(P)-binding protein n=1 Tax=Aureobasidium namibiae CBS 147.97 TaxID=1043004 RepID=A0A074WYF3_9PEZI|nr:uncharacterized protein M436DRAFT_42599 [Aureobasidium namibiae CBS 147.97]KEQ74797.1 hypothetical protein M436DRAFT_42599 [Aureobasidium namibiae CBS 147.97]